MSKLYFMNPETRTSNVSLETVPVLVGYSEEYLGTQRMGMRNSRDYKKLFSIWRTKDIAIMKPRYDDKWRLHIAEDGREFAFERKGDAIDWAKAMFA